MTVGPAADGTGGAVCALTSSLDGKSGNDTFTGGSLFKIVSPRLARPCCATLMKGARLRTTWSLLVVMASPPRPGGDYPEVRA